MTPPGTAAAVSQRRAGLRCVYRRVGASTGITRASCEQRCRKALDLRGEKVRISLLFDLRRRAGSLRAGAPAALFFGGCGPRPAAVSDLVQFYTPQPQYTETYLIGGTWKDGTGDGVSMFMLSALLWFCLSSSKFPDSICLFVYKKWGRSVPFARTSLIPVRFTLLYYNAVCVRLSVTV